MSNEAKFIILVNKLRDNINLTLRERYEYAAEIKKMYEAVCSENQILSNQENDKKGRVIHG